MYQEFITFMSKHADFDWGIFIFSIVIFGGILIAGTIEEKRQKQEKSEDNTKNTN